MGIYKIEHYTTGLCLSVLEPVNDHVRKHQTVTVMRDVGTRAQRWSIDAISTGVSIRTMLNTTFALSYSASSSDCDLNHVYGNGFDTTVDFESELGNACCIKLTNYSLYLTYDGSRVYWAAKTGNDSQKWKFSFARENFPPANHSYEYDSSRNLHVITTAASNIKLINFAPNDSKIEPSGYCGVNGTFFDSGIVSIAVQDGATVSNMNRGFWNGTGKGGIGWNGTSVEWFQFLEDARPKYAAGEAYAMTNTWLQGGIALWLGYSDWRTKYDEQATTPSAVESLYEYVTEPRPRTAMVANLLTNTIELIVCTNNIHLENFRAAIQSRYGISDGAAHSTTYQAILLDGGISTQLVAKDSETGVAVVAAAANLRAVKQIVSLKNFN